MNKNVQFVVGLALVAGAIYLYRKNQKEKAAAIKIYEKPLGIAEELETSNFYDNINDTSLRYQWNKRKPIQDANEAVFTKSNFSNAIGFGLDGRKDLGGKSKPDWQGECRCGRENVWAKECCNKK